MSWKKIKNWLKPNPNKLPKVVQQEQSSPIQLPDVVNQKLAATTIDPNNKEEAQHIGASIAGVMVALENAKKESRTLNLLQLIKEGFANANAIIENHKQNQLTDGNRTKTD